jgi:hypothetical protein
MTSHLDRAPNCFALGVSLALLSFASCGHRADDCEYLRACPPASGGTSSGGSGNASGGGSFGGGGAPSQSGGSAGEGGTGGSEGGAAPCNETCRGTTPVCDEVGARCVECLESDQCAAPTPICDPTTNTCVGCVASTDCGEPNPVCDAAARVCVECASSADCSGATPFCDTATQSCVACLTQSDCEDPATAQCASDHSCKPCLNSAHCTAIPGRPICASGTCVECTKQSDCNDSTASQCDMTTKACVPCTSDAHCSNIAGKSVCLAGECVQCTAANPSACGIDAQSGAAFVCDSVKHTCTTSLASSANVCKPCVSDAQCYAGQRCVLDTIGTGASAKDVGYFCHWKKGDTTNGAPADCFGDGRPYAKTIAAMTIDGESADICVLRVSSCVAGAEFSTKNCAQTGTPDDAACGFAPPVDAKCIPVTGSSAYRCTMRCLSDEDCPDGSPCDTSLRLCQL